MSEKSSDVVTQLDESIVIQKELDYMPDLEEIRKKPINDMWSTIFNAQKIVDETKKLSGVGPIIEMDKPLPKKESKSKREMKEAVKEVLRELLEGVFKKD